MKTTLSLSPLSALLFVLVACLSAPPAAAEVVVISSKRGALEQLSQDEVAYIFLGRYRKLPDGSTARPFDLDAESPIRKVFYRQLLDKSMEEINAYRNRLVFSGRSTPPAETKGREDLLARLENDPSAIGYIDRDYLNRSASARNVKVILSLPD